MSEPSDEQIMAWRRDLRRMADEADQAYGDPAPGRREAKIAALLNLAWDAVWAEQRDRVALAAERAAIR